MPNEIFEYYFDKILSIIQLYLTIRIYMQKERFMLKVYFSNKYIF